MYEIQQFYNDLGIFYINEFDCKHDLLVYLKNNVRKGDKKKFALGFSYDEKREELSKIRLDFQHSKVWDILLR